MIDPEALIDKLMILNEHLWEGRVDRPRIDLWLRNFTGATTHQCTERNYALLLLSHVMYFGERELRELLRALYRDQYRYRLIQQIRTRRGRTTPIPTIHQEYEAALHCTRFLPLGNPSESSTHLMYWFRQENLLPQNLFEHPDDLFFDARSTQPDGALTDPNVRRLVFIDDFCGSGSQALEFAATQLPRLRHLARNAAVTLEFGYLVLFATAAGIARIRDETSFDWVGTVYELDDTYKIFSSNARQFATVPTTVDRNAVRELALAYGKKLYTDSPLGFEDGQLLLAFHHNTPDNSLPILWAGPPDHPQWRNVFHRYPKYYANKHN